MTTSKPRLVTRLPDEIDFRLRMTAVVEDRPLTEVLADTLGKGLRTAEQLADLVRKGCRSAAPIADRGVRDDIAS